MTTYVRCLIAGPVALAPQARLAALTWDATAGTMYGQASLYLLDGGDPAVPTHTASFGDINADYVPAIEAAIAAESPDWQMIQQDDVDAALAAAGLARVTPTMP